MLQQQADLLPPHQPGRKLCHGIQALLPLAECAGLHPLLLWKAVQLVLSALAIQSAMHMVMATLGWMVARWVACLVACWVACWVAKVADEADMEVVYSIVGIQSRCGRVCTCRSKAWNAPHTTFRTKVVGGARVEAVEAAEVLETRG